MSQTIWQRRECVSAEVEGSLVLLDLETLVYHSLNTTAAAVWQLLEEPKSKDDLCSSLCERYDVTPEHCDQSLQKLLDELTSKNLVAPVGPAVNSAA